ncbi:hypothetical protein pdam_00018078 [Pocillopora damicornis]|uniref:Uncharacterized protein n=1 Tax=Pocillopora damicornis TaxID=46731 RepID=A0A3M6V5S1_POCDA|nr:hypothetical protein pdam_00018078 [Pocillopora damicornis]
MAFLCRRARRNHEGNEGVEEIYVACIDNKDLAEVIMKDMNADTEEKALLEENALIPLLDVENDNTDTQLNKKTHTHDDGSVDSIPRVSCEERGNACTLARAALLNEIRRFCVLSFPGKTILVITGSLESFLRCKDYGSNEYANVHC